jgi:hypothetical protein
MAGGARVTAVARHVWLMLRAPWLVLRRRPEVPADGEAIPYGGPLRPMMWVFTALTPFEIVLVELAVPWPAVRVPLAALGVLSTLWFLALIATMSVYPHSVDPRVLRLRHCSFFDRRLPVTDIDSAVVVRRDHAAKDSGKVVDGALVLDVVGSTNVSLVLRGASALRGVHFWADDPARAVRLIRARLQESTVS